MGAKGGGLGGEAVGGRLLEGCSSGALRQGGGEAAEGEARTHLECSHQSPPPCAGKEGKEGREGGEGEGGEGRGWRVSASTLSAMQPIS